MGDTGRVIGFFLSLLRPNGTRQRASNHDVVHPHNVGLVNFTTYLTCSSVPDLFPERLINPTALSDNIRV